MEFTIIYDDKPGQIVDGTSIQDIYKRLELSGEDYVEVIPGRKKIPPAAVKRFNSDPMAVLLSQVTPENSSKPKAQKKIIPSSAPVLNEAVEQPTASIPTPTERVFTPAPVQPVVETQYFEENGIEFKVENNVLFKKTWVDIDEKEVRIINKASGKKYTGDKYSVQLREWEPLNKKIATAR
jgi:hypothetical protein